MPWIDQFLASTPPTPQPAVMESPERAATLAAERQDGADLGATVAPGDPAATAAPANDAGDAADEAWPLAEATARLEELRPALVRVETEAMRPEQLFAEPGSVEPLAPWSDDDLIDIMPTAGGVHLRSATPPYPGPRVTPSGVTPSLEVPAADAAPAAPGEAVARALEALAQRVRSGELALPGFDSAAGDTGVLVAALAALHGVR